MKLKAFAIHNAKEILRDPLNLGFGTGFPAVFLLLFGNTGKCSGDFV